MQGYISIIFTGKKVDTDKLKNYIHKDVSEDISYIKSWWWEPYDYERITDDEEVSVKIEMPGSGNISHIDVEEIMSKLNNVVPKLKIECRKELTDYGYVETYELDEDMDDFSFDVDVDTECPYCGEDVNDTDMELWYFSSNDQMFCSKEHFMKFVIDIYCDEYDGNREELEKKSFEEIEELYDEI